MAKRGRRQIEKNLKALVKFPGINLAHLYRGVIEEARALGRDPNSPNFPGSVQLLDKVTVKILARELAKEHPDTQLVMRIQRGIMSAEGHAVARFVAESQLGAAAMCVDGTNRLLQLRSELQAEKTTAKSVDNPGGGS